MKKFHTTTLGCKINQYETQAITEAWMQGGAVEIDQPGEADILLVNSCAVTANAISDLRQTVRKLHRQSPQADIVITGCAAQVLADQLAELPGVTRVVPQSDKRDLLGALPGQDAVFAIHDYPRARAVAMVQDGCSHRCTYCIVPLTRGRSVSRPVAEIEAEVERLLAAGFREIILSGVNLRQFGRDLPGEPLFWDLVDHLEERFASDWAGSARLRISSLEPGQLGERALTTLAASRLVCPQLHLSLQSGDPEVLRLMGRGHYSPEPVLDFLRELESVWPVYGLGADILVGFPGETREMFNRTLVYVTKLPLSYAHVFPYSPRPGTIAEGFSGQVAPEEKKRRAAEIRKVVGVKKRDFLKRLTELDRLDIVVQDEAGNGVSQFYAACRLVSGPPVPAKRLVSTRPLRIERGVIVVELLK